MKAHLTKVSLALLSTVFLLGCQEQGSGPVGPEGPQFDKADGGFCPVPRDVKGHCHVDGGETVLLTFTVQMEGVNISSGLADNTNDPCVGCNTIIVDPFVLSINLDFFTLKLSCSIQIPNPNQNGILSLSTGDDHVHINFRFFHSGAEHILGLLADRPSSNWPPAVGGSAVTLMPKNKNWSITSKGKNHQKACTGTGDDIGEFTVNIGEVSTT